MKVGNIFLAFGAIFFLVNFGILGYFFIYSGNDFFNQEVENQMISLLNIKKGRVDDIILNMESDIKILANSKNVFDVLERDLVVSEFAAKQDVEKRFNLIYRDVQNYMKAHPNMTLAQLKNSKEFQIIAVQRIGVEGDSFILNSKMGEIYFHRYPSMIGVKVTSFFNDSLSIEEAAMISREEGVFSGFYFFEDVSGKLRKKYAHYRRLDVSTADGVSFILGVSTYVDNYMIAFNISKESKEYLENFVGGFDYHDMLIVSSDGYVSYKVRDIDFLGVNLNNVIGMEELSNAYLFSKEFGDVYFWGPFHIHMNEEYLKVLVSLPIYIKGEYSGMIVLLKDMKDVNDIVGDFSGLGERGEMYLVNDEGFLVTPLKNANFDLLIQKIGTKNAEECLEYFEEISNKKIEFSSKDFFDKKNKSFYEFTNYMGDLTLGTDISFEKTRWCLLSEIGVNEIFEEPERKRNKKDFCMIFLVFFIVSILFVLIRNFLNKKYFLEEKKESFLLRMKRMNLFRKIGKRESVLFGIFLSLMYFFIMNRFFETTFDIVLLIFFSLVSFFFSVILFFYSFSFKENLLKINLFLGGILMMLYNLFFMFSISYRGFENFLDFGFFTFIIFFQGLGFLFLLFSLKGVRK